jgi:transposase-like protein
LYAAIDIDTKLILDVALFGRWGTDPAAAFLHGLREKHDLPDAEFLIDQFGYRTALPQLGLSGRVDYTDRNRIERWFHTLTMRVDRFHTSWGAVGQASVNGLNCSCITITVTDRIRLSMENASRGGAELDNV